MRRVIGADSKQSLGITKRVRLLNNLCAIEEKISAATFVLAMHRHLYQLPSVHALLVSDARHPGRVVYSDQVRSLLPG